MKKRVEIQLKHQVDQRTYIDSLQSQMTSAYREITQTLTLSQDKLQAQSSRIFSLLIKYVSDFAIMVRTIKGSDLTRQEEETWKLLKDVVKAYEAAGNGGRMEGRLAEFWAFILKLKQVVDGGYQSGGRFDWNAVSELELSNVSSPCSLLMLSPQYANHTLMTQLCAYRSSKSKEKHCQLSETLHRIKSLMWRLWKRACPLSANSGVHALHFIVQNLVLMPIKICIVQSV